jgi:hypothetical protein
MNEATFERKLNELVQEIGTVPSPERKKLISWTKKAGIYQKHIKNSADALQESLDYLRVSIKYILFDLEATRRENAYLKKLLGDKDSSS